MVSGLIRKGQVKYEGDIATYFPLKRSPIDRKPLDADWLPITLHICWFFKVSITYPCVTKPTLTNLNLT